MDDDSDGDLPELVNSSSSEDESDDDAPATRNLAGASSQAVTCALLDGAIAIQRCCSAK